MSRPPVLIAASAEARPVRLTTSAQVATLTERETAWAGANGFEGKAGQLLILPGDDGAAAGALFGVGQGFDPLSARGLAARLPGGAWRLNGVEGRAAELASLAFALGSYRFDRYKTRPDREAPVLAVAEGVDPEPLLNIASACALAREMVDTPAADMGPLQMETVAREIAEAHGATISVVTGDGLLEENYPAIHAVGRAAAPHRAPRIIEIGWNLDKADRPLIALVGKGVAFDTGGLDLKPAASRSAARASSSV